jgi:NitT/TauT family transport system permease protein
LKSDKWNRWAWPVGTHLAVLVLWWAVTNLGSVPKYILPTPQDTIATLTQEHYRWPVHVTTTAIEVFGGYLLAVVVGVALALVTSWSRWLAVAVMPLLITMNMIPKIAMAPLFIVWLSYGVVPNIIITFTICFFPIVLTTARGLKEVEPDLIDLARAVRATRWQIFSKIQFPSALPYIFSGMKVATVFAVAGAVVGEFIGSEQGLGNLMLSAQATLDTAAMFMAVILITLVGVVLYGLVLLLEHWLIVADARVE